MNKKLFENFFNYLIYALAILLAFLLVFESFLEFPLLVSWLGRLHPLILHFPIVLVLVTIVQFWRKDRDAPIYLGATTILTLISAITGFILSMDGGSKGDLLQIHQWMAVAVCLLLVVWYYWRLSIQGFVLKVLQLLLITMIVFTGHFGGMVTHGQDFLALRSNDDIENVSLPDDPNIYTDIVQPILDRKCVACHNENKAKGEFIMTDHAALLKGGKTTSILDESQGMLHRISLPIEDEQHMPPPDEQQLDKDEIMILQEWLEHKAPADLKYSGLQHESKLRELVSEMIQERNQNLWSDFPEISDDRIAEISSEYCTIKRIYGGSDALQVIVFPHKSFSSREIQKLEALAKNTVELKLSNLPLGKEDFETLSSFQNLEHLDLSGCRVAEGDLRLLQKLEKLKILKIYNTEIGDESVEALATIPSLTSLYIYQTKLSRSGIDNLAKSNASLNIIEYESKALEFKSILPTPTPEPVKFFFKDPFYLNLLHPLDQIDIRYTLDGSEPNSNSSIMNDSILVNNNMTLNYFASKDGWEASDIESMQFLRSSVIPVSFELKNSPDKKYTGIGKALLFDLEKGPENFGADSWMAFKDEPFSLLCSFEQEVTIKEVILSSMVHTDPYLFPPSTIRIYGGAETGKLRLIGSHNPPKLNDRQERRFEFYHASVDPKAIKVLRVDVTPLNRIPAWHQGKGEKGWFFIDEVVFIAD